jgi:hypothetical protein
MLDLNALAAQVRTESRINSPKASLNARVAQRESAEYLADLHARAEEKRLSLARALSGEGIDATRFRWLGEHSSRACELCGQSLDEIRRTIDGWISDEAKRRLIEMRREFAERTGRRLPELEFDRV